MHTLKIFSNFEIYFKKSKKLILKLKLHMRAQFLTLLLLFFVLFLFSLLIYRRECFTVFVLSFFSFFFWLFNLK